MSQNFYIFLFFFTVSVFISAQEQRGTEVALTAHTNTAMLNKTHGSNVRVVCANNNYAYSIWWDARETVSNDKNSLYFNRSTDGGQSWGKEYRINTTPCLSLEIKENYDIVCSANGQKVYVTWHLRKGYFDKHYIAVSSDYGQTFSAEKRITSLNEDGDEDAFTLCCSEDGMTAYLVFSAQILYGQSSYAYFIYTTDGGTTWSSPIRLSSSETYWQEDTLACCSKDGRYLHALWSDDRESGRCIYIHTWDRDKNGTNQGDWSQDEVQYVDQSEPYRVVCSNDGKMVHVVWKVGYSLDHRYYLHNGTSWVLDTNIYAFADCVQNGEFALYCYGNNFCAAVFERIGIDDPYKCIYTSRWDGNVWSAPLKIGTPSPDTHFVENVSICGYGADNLWCVFEYTEDAKDRRASKVKSPVALNRQQIPSHHRKIRGNVRKYREDQNGTAILKASSSDGAQTWTQATKLSPNIQWGHNPHIACSPDGNNVCTVWDDARNFEGPHRPWAKNLQYSETLIFSDYECAAKAKNPSVMQSGDEVYVTWHEDKDNQNNIMFRKSSDRGKTWSNAIQINQYHVRTTAVMCRDNIYGTLYIAWAGDDASHKPYLSSIFVASSSNKGDTWSSPELITSMDEYRPCWDMPWQPFSFGATHGNVYLAWESEYAGTAEIYFCRKPDGGNWSSHVCVSCKMGTETDLGNEGEYESYNQTMAFDAYGHVYLVWSDEWTSGETEPGDVYLRTSSDYGLTWNAPFRIDNDNESCSYAPQVSTVNERIYVVWTEVKDSARRGISSSIYFRDFNGTTWNSPRRIDGDSVGTRDSGFPWVAVQDSSIYIAFMDSTSQNYDVYFIYSSNFGETFSSPRLLNISTSRDRVLTAISARDSHVRIAWMEEIEGKWSAKSKHSADYGSTWYATQSIYYSTTAHALIPQIMGNGNYASAVWCDDREGTWNVYFKSLP